MRIAAVAFLFQLPFFDRWFGVMDEGHMLQFADVIASGGMLYRDATSYPLPGAFYLLAGIFRLFDPSILVSRWVVVVEFSAFVAIVYTIVRRGTSTLYANLCALLLLLYRVWAFPHWQMFNYSTTALLVLSASLLCVIHFVERNDRRVLAAAGLLFGLGVFCKQDYGAAMLLTIVVTLIVFARGGPPALRRPLAPLMIAFFLPAALVGAAAGIHFWMQGQLAFVIQLTVLNHFVGLSTFEYESFPGLLPLFGQDSAYRSHEALYAFFPAIVSTAEGAASFQNYVFARTAVYDNAIKLFIYGPVALVAFGVVRQWRNRRELTDPSRRAHYVVETAIVAVAASYGLLISFYRPQDYVHLAVLYWAFIALGVLLLHAAVARRRRFAWVAVALLALPLIAATGYTGRLIWKLREIHSEAIPSARAGVYTKPPEAHLLGELIDYIHANSAPGDPVAAMPYFPILQFLADRDAPHAASYILWPFPEYPDRDDRIIAAMERSKTPLVIYNYTQFPNFPSVPEYAPALFEYLVDQFEVDRVFNDSTFGYSIAGLKRQGAAPVGTALFAGDADRGSLRRETASGFVQPIDAERRNLWVEMGNWPFRPVMALRPAAGGGRSVLSLPVEIPDGGAALETSIGVHPEFWFRYPPSWVRYQIEVVSDGTRESLYDRTLDPQQVLEDRGWFDVDISLDDYRGRHIELEFATSTAWPMAENPRMGGFGEPILVERAATEDR